MASTKMFVHYSGTVESFKQLSNISDYNNKIVFIKGGSDGKGAAIYTHGSYFANFTEFLGAVNFVKGVNVGGTNYNAAANGGYLAFTAADPATVAINVDHNGIAIGLTKTFVDRVSAVETLADNTADALGTAGDAAKADGSAFARIAKLAVDLAALTGSGNGSVSDQIAALKQAIEGDLSDTTDSKTLAAINDELNAIDAKWVSYVSKTDLEGIEGSDNGGDKVKVTVASKGGKVTEVTVDESGLTNALNLKANAADVYTKSDVNTTLTNYYTKEETFNKGEVTKAITDEVAKIINDNDATSIDTLEEIAAWIAAHPESVAAINREISGLKELVGTTSVASQIGSKIETLKYTDTAVTGEYVSAVSEANGIISVTRAALPTYTLAEGTANGTVKFNGNNVKVHGLGSAAYTEAGAYATAAQGATADSALQSIAKGTDGDYVTTSVSGKASNKQTVAVSVTVKKVADATAAKQGLADAYEAKTYTDAAQSAAQTYADALFAWEEL